MGVPCKWTNDSKQFILDNFDSIKDCPTRMYNSALKLCPSSSWLHQYCSTEFSQKVKVVVGPARWGTCFRTISCSNFTHTLAYWNNKIAASPVKCYDILIFDTLTGSQVSVLSGHTDNVYSLAFSSDGKLLVSGSWDKTVKLWDVQTGGVIETLCSDTDLVCSVSISADNTMIAVGHYYEAIHLYNINTGNCHIIEGHGEQNTVTFSPTNPELLLSSSRDGTVQQWGIDGHQIGPQITGNHAEFSSDGTQFLTCNGRTVTIRDTGSKATMMEFSLVSDASHCYFSPNGRSIAATDHNIIHLWDITGPNPHPIQTLTGHTQDITSVVFASSTTLISTSRDRSIKFWQIGTSLADPVAPGSESMPLTSAPIKSVSLQAKDGLAFSIDSEGIVKTWDIKTGYCEESYTIQDKDVIGGDVQLVDGRLIIVWCNKYLHVYAWDAEKGKHQIGHVNIWSTNCLRIIGDGSRVLHVGQGSIQVWSIWTRGSIHEVKLERSAAYHLDSLRMDNSKVLVSLDILPVQGWDFGVPGSIPTQFSTDCSDMPHLNFTIATWLKDSLARIEDRITGQEVFQLCGQYAKPATTQWDGQYLIAGYPSGEVLILYISNVLS